MIEDFTITVRPANESELEMLEKEFSPGYKSRHHFQRFEKQKTGKGLYLIAWHNNVPVGHFLLEWDGPEDPTVATQIDIHKRAYLFALGTREEYRRRGVATRMIQTGERLAKEHGCEWIGVEVGKASNPDARRLYEKLEYKDWDRGEFIVSSDYIIEDSQKYTEFEAVIYMDKKLL